MPKEIKVKSVLNRTKRRDPWFLDDYTLNPYSSCAFNCLYCYIRGSKYGSNLERSLSVKTNMAELLDHQLRNRARKGDYGIIVLSSATDPYPNIEKNYGVTRDALEIIRKHKFPVHIITKSNLIERDFDLLKEIEREAILSYDLKSLQRGVMISYSFSTLQDGVAKIFEPGAPPPSQRIETVRKTLDRGFLTGVNLMPLLPYISDTSEQLHLAFSTFRDLKVDYIFPASITLFGTEKASSKTLMLNAIKKHYPELEEKYRKFFSNNNEMPQYYQEAFQEKINELLAEYNLCNSILEGASRKQPQL